MRLELFERRLRPGARVQGRAEASGPILVRLRGEATTFRPADAPGGPSGWVAETEVLLWEEHTQESSAETFDFALPADCLPTAVGQRLRIVYTLEVCSRLEGRLEGMELEVLPSAWANQPEMRVPLEHQGDEPSGEVEPEALPEPVTEEAPASSWLAQFLEGKNRMDRILERAVRGKLVEPEDLLAMQASMYGYSKVLAQIQPTAALPAEEIAARVPREPAGDLIVERESIARGRILRLRLDLPEEFQVQEFQATLAQKEISQCQGIESRLEQTVGMARRSVKENPSLELTLPVGLLPTVDGDRLRIEYVLSVTVRTNRGSLCGSTRIRVTGS